MSKRAVARILIASLAFLLCDGCTPDPNPTPPSWQMPSLLAVLVSQAGQPRTLVPRQLGGQYPLLPTSSITVRLRLPYAVDARNYYVDAAGQRLQYVAIDDVPTLWKLQQEGVGYYTVDTAGLGLGLDLAYYDVVILLPVALQINTTGFTVNLVGFTGAEALVDQRPPAAEMLALPLESRNAVKSPTEPSDVFLCGDSGKNCKRSQAVVARDIVIAGWLSEDLNAETTNANWLICRGSANCFEDYHYRIILDPDFMSALYGPSGMSSALTGAMLPADWPATFPDFHDQNPLPFAATKLAGGSHIVDINSFALPLGDYITGPKGVLPQPVIIPELNVWHVNDAGNWTGRGAAPTGWVEKEYPPAAAGSNQAAQIALKSQSWWPYDPDTGARADQTRPPLQPGDYVVIKGTLLEDFPHKAEANSLWNTPPTSGHGHLEIHPPDWIDVIRPTPPMTKTVGVLMAIADPRATSNGVTTTTVVGAISHRGIPAGATVKSVVELIDDRWTNRSTVTTDLVTQGSESAVATVSVTSSPGVQGRFKATYIVTWDLSGVRSPISAPRKAARRPRGAPPIDSEQF